MRSLKRKRVDEEAEEETPEVVIAAEPCSPLIIVEDSPLFEMPVPEIPLTQDPVIIPDLAVVVPHPEVPVPEVPTLEPARPMKRARTAMHTVAHTAAAMAIGAAATWSALAFS